MIRFVLACWLIASITLAQSPKEKDESDRQKELAKKPQWQRMLTGEDAKKAAELQKQIERLDAADNVEEAIKLAESLIAIRQSLQGEDHYQFNDAKRTLAELKKPRKTPEQRRQHAEAQRLSNLSISHFQKANYKEACKLGEQALQLGRTAFGEKHDVTATLSNSLGNFYQADGRYPEALTQLKFALVTWTAIVGENHPDTATAMNNLSTLYQASGRFAEAEPFCRDALKIRRELLGIKHRNTVTSLNNLATLYHAQAKYAEAEPLFRESIEISKEVFGEKHPNTANSIFNLAVLYQTIGKYADSESRHRDALRISEAVQGEKHPDTAMSLCALASLYQLQGRYEEAEPMFRRALKNLKEQVGDDHPLTATCLHYLAMLFRDQGRHTEGVQILREALRIKADAFGVDDLETADGLFNLGLLFRDQGKYFEAEPFFADALRIRKRIRGENHPETAAGLSALAGVYTETERQDEAESLFLESLRIRKANRQESNPEAATTINNLAKLYESRGKLAESEKYIRGALRVLKETLGEKHPHIAVVLVNLAVVCQLQSKIQPAEKLFEEALLIQKSVLGARHPNTTAILSAFAFFYLAQGKLEKASTLLKEAIRSHEASRLDVARPIERSLGTMFHDPYPAFTVVAVSQGKFDIGFQAFENTCSRGLLDENSARLGQTLSTEESTHRRQITSQLVSMDARVLRLTSQPSRSSAEEKELSALVAERRKLDDSLATLAARVSRREVADLAAIRSSLGEDAAILTWVDVHDKADRLQHHWACVVRRTGETRWERLPGTGEKNQWTKADAELPRVLLAAVSSGAPATEIATLRKQLYSQRVAPVLKHLAGVKTLHVIAVNDMAGIPMDVVTSEYSIGYVPSGTFLARRAKPLTKTASLLAVGDPVYPELGPVKLSTALPPSGLLIKQVVPEGAAAKRNLIDNDVLVSYAGVKLESVEQLGKLISEKAREKEITIEFWREADDKVVKREIPPGRLGVLLAPEPARQAISAKREASRMVAKLSRGGDWKELPGTQVEVSELEKLFGKDKATILTRSKASEPRLEAMRKNGDLTKFRYLHFATHGEADNTRAFDSKLIFSQDQTKEILSRPGEPLLNNELSASEVLEYWKLDAELVTLSACETALGRSGGGDGMLGFAQAFLLAGSRAVCLSLWKVDDTATALLMDRFYRNLLGKRGDRAKPMGKAAALSEAKTWLKDLSLTEATDRLGIITDGVSRGPKQGREVLPEIPLPKTAGKDVKPYSHPRYWAAFILIGDPD